MAGQERELGRAGRQKIHRRNLGLEEEKRVEQEKEERKMPGVKHPVTQPAVEQEREEDI